MTKTLKIYKEDDVIASEQGEDKASVALSNLEADTTYPEGTYQMTWEENSKESGKVDVPQFKINPILVSGVSFIPGTRSIMINIDDNIESNIVPSTATNKILKYIDEHPELVIVDENTRAIHGVVEDTSVITTMPTDGDDKPGRIPVTATNG